MNKTIRTTLALSLLGTITLIAGNAFLSRSKVLADDSLGKKMQNDAADASKKVKKGKRGLAKKVRDKTGHGSVVKDVEDSGDNLKDDVSTEAGKLKRKID